MYQIDPPNFAKYPIGFANPLGSVPIPHWPFVPISMRPRPEPDPVATKSAVVLVPWTGLGPIALGPVGLVAAVPTPPDAPVQPQGPSPRLGSNAHFRDFPFATDLFQTAAWLSWRSVKTSHRLICPANQPWPDRRRPTRSRYLRPVYAAVPMPMSLQSIQRRHFPNVCAIPAQRRQIPIAQPQPR